MSPIFTKILIDFINEHEVIGYDIISELHKFDLYIKGYKHPAFPSDALEEDPVNLEFYKKSLNNDKIIMDYADYSWNCQGEMIYSCKLCKDNDMMVEKDFTIMDDFLGHMEKLHATLIKQEQEEHILDKKSEELWVGELEKMKKSNYKHHSEEFLKEIDEILGVDDFDMSGILNSLEKHKTQEDDNNFESLSDSSKENALSPSITSTSSLSSPSPLTQPLNDSNHEHVQKRKKKRTSGQCDVCNRTFNDLYNLRIHKMIHTGEKPFQCEECGKRFRQYNKLKIHCITHTNEKPYICDICYKGFRFRNYLSVHKRLHSGENPYKCKYCDKYFHSLHSRRLHTKMQHCETKIYTCPICGKILTAQCYLTAHMKRHTNQRDFKCEMCGKCFFSQSQLKDHQLVHTNLKPYECNVCKARFQRKSNYTQHLKIHTGEKTYVCGICKKSFAQNAGLYGHMKSHAKL
ncbi:uncharacterized protein ACRADG_008865 [Cochliomyia hominivorax]